MEPAGVRAIPFAAGRDATGEHPPLVAATRTSSGRPFQFLGQATRTFPKTWHLAGETDGVAVRAAQRRNRGRAIQSRSSRDQVETKALPMAIHHLHGELVEKQPTRVVIDVGGVGYEVIVPLSSHACLPDVGATARILTVEQHRDDVRLLFGFATDAERRMFRLLTTVSGVGPKLAIATLGHLSVDRLAGCILAGDTAAIRKIPGVGQKLADRIVLELRTSIAVDAGATGPARPTAAVGDAEAALVSLGYRPEDARRLVDAALRKHSDQSDDVEALIRLAIAR